RQDEDEAAAFADRALGPNFPAMQRHQLARDRQAEAGAAVLARVAAVDLAEALEDHLEVLGGNADAGVFDREAPVRRAGDVLFGDLDVDATAFRRELDGVAEQVDEDLRQLQAVGTKLERASRRQAHAERDLLLLRQRLDRVDQLGEQRRA